MKFNFCNSYNTVENLKYSECLLDPQIYLGPLFSPPTTISCLLATSLVSATK